MSQMNPILLAIIKETFNCDGDAIQDDLDLRDLAGWDSLNHMTFIMTIEKEYGIELSGDDIADMVTLGNIRRILETNHDIQA